MQRVLTKYANKTLWYVLLTTKSSLVPPSSQLLKLTGASWDLIVVLLTRLKNVNTQQCAKLMKVNLLTRKWVELFYIELVSIRYIMWRIGDHFLCQTSNKCGLSVHGSRLSINTLSFYKTRLFPSGAARENRLFLVFAPEPVKTTTNEGAHFLCPTSTNYGLPVYGSRFSINTLSFYKTGLFVSRLCQGWLVKIAYFWSLHRYQSKPLRGRVPIFCVQRLLTMVYQCTEADFR